MNREKLILRIFLSIIGMFILGTGVSIIIKSNLGVDPASTLQLGLVNILGFSYGTCAMIYNIIILSIIFFIDKKYINISSVLAIFVIGYTVDFMLHLMSGVAIEEMAIITRITLLLIGAFICSFGVTIYILSDLGIGATDCVAEIISDKLDKPYRIVRMFSDLLFVVIGYFLGGPVGIGTIILAIIVGPFIQISRKILHSVISENKFERQLTESDFEKDIII